MKQNGDICSKKSFKFEIRTRETGRESITEIRWGKDKIINFFFNSIMVFLKKIVSMFDLVVALLSGMGKIPYLDTFPDTLSTFTSRKTGKVSGYSVQ